MANNFEQWQGDWEDKVPEEIGHNILHQANTLSHFGRVIELFVPNALQTAAQLIGGSSPSGPRPRPNGGRYSPPVIPPGRPPAGGSGTAREQRLPSDPETT
ncbi:MAG: hypothetical protein IPK76_06410 [Lewinellaceae bacterium]|nr:hypothetical protein [Lewinellaceae bacterium]